MAKMKLYGMAGSRAARSLWMARELGLDFEHIPTNFATETKTDEYLAINPNGRVPAIDEDGFILWESMAINLYLAKKHDAGLWPKTLEDEGRTFQWSFWGMTEIEKPLLDVLFHRAFLPEDQRKPELAEAGEEALQKPLAVLNDALEGRDYLLDGEFSVADLNVASVLAWARMGQLDMSAVPNVDAWLTRCMERPAFNG